MSSLKELEEIVLNEIQKGAFPGCNYGIVFKDKFYVNSLGNKAIIPTVEKNSIDTLYDMASCSKVIATTSCILKLLEEGRLRLHTKVSTILPRFRHLDTTIFDLITHTSGLREDVAGTHDIKSCSEAMDKIYSEELIYAPHSKILYSDTGFVLLGKIVEAITNMSLDEYAYKVVFNPCEMIDTCYNPQDINRCAPTELRVDNVYNGIVRGHVHDEQAYGMGGVAGHAGVFSTVSDCCHFIQMTLNKGVYNNTKVFSEESIDLLYKPLVKETTGVNILGTIRGVGWMFPGDYPSCGDFCSSETILHTGFTGTNIFIDRINEIGFVMLSNRVHPTRKNTLHIESRPLIANYIMTHKEALKGEINE